MKWTDEDLARADAMHTVIALNGLAMGLRPGQSFRLAFWASLAAALEHGISPEDLKSDVDELVAFKKAQDERPASDRN